ncbi:MAG: diguanylate cyclase [Candidatus Omnitrophica bacterium]|nr:diguanylate cyclase [Candidatus Omnitrophota bacterium]
MNQKSAGWPKEYQELISIFNCLDELIYVVDPKSYEILYVNPALKKSFGEVVGQKCYQVFQRLDKPCPFCTNKYIFGPRGKPVYIWEFQNKVNKRWYRCIDRRLTWIDGREVRFELAIDVTDKKLIEESLRRSEKRYRQLWDDAPVAYHIVDRRGIIKDVNRTETKLLGYRKKEMIGKSIFNFVSPEQRKQARERFKEKLRGKKVESYYDRVYLKKDGTPIFVSIHDVPERNQKGDIIGMRTAMIDISELKRLEKTLAETSLRDDLTGVYNRRGFFTLAEQEMKRTQRRKNPFQLLFIDLDRLKSINDTKGHSTGDEALKNLAEILKGTFRKSDILARIGGDEFVVLAPEVKGRRQGKILIRRLRERIQKFNLEKGKEYQISVSLGVVRYDGKKDVTIDQLLSQADREMYREKIQKYKGEANSEILK